MQNIRINMQTLCGNRWKDEWWLKENWRRDAARFSIPPRPSPKADWRQVEAAHHSALRLQSDGQIVTSGGEFGLTQHPLPHHGPVNSLLHEASAKKENSGLHQQGIISVMQIKEESIIIPGKKARAACECAARNTWDGFKGISERTKSKLCRAGASCSSSQRPFSEPARRFLNINLDSVRCLKKMIKYKLEREKQIVPGVLKYLNQREQK